MKIVRIIARLNVGGPARHVVWLTKELQTGEFESVLLTGKVPAGEEDMNYFASEHGVAPVFIPEMSRELSPKDLISLWKVLREIKRQKPDIIHTHTAKAGTIGRVAGFFYRRLGGKNVRLVHTYHGHVFHSYYGKAKTKFFLLIEKVLARATDKIIVISEQQKREINEKFGVGKDAQFEVIPLGIDLSVFRDWKSKKNLLREEVGAASDELLVGIVGRLTEIKNIPLFLRTAQIYQEKKDGGLPRLKFLVIGDGHLRRNLEKEAENSGLKDSVVFLGNRNDADVFYAGLDIVALTSLNEGTPLSLIEAMANEKPVIATAVGGVTDLLGAVSEEKGNFKICERGISVESEDAEGVFAGLIYLAEKETLRNSLAEAGRNFVFENYDKKRLVADIQNLYRNLISS